MSLSCYMYEAESGHRAADYQKAFEQLHLINLKQVKLDGRLNTGPFIALLKYCPNLISVSCAIDNVEGLSKLVSDSSPNYLNLQKLELDVCYFVENEFRAVTNVGNLRELKITSPCNIFYSSLRPFGNLINLEVLTLDNCLNLDRNLFKSLVDGCPNLLEVNLKSMSVLKGSVRAFKTFILKNLETLHVEKCPGLRGPDIAALIHGCQKIKKITLSDIDEWSTPEVMSLLREGKALGDLVAKLQVPDLYKKMFMCLDDGKFFE
jgi:hypothetical protein